MKITLLTYGSRGDVQPFLALAVGLQKAGHTVTLAAPHRFGAFVTGHGIQFAPLAGDPEEISKGFNDAGGNVLRMVKSMQDYVFTIAADVVRQARAACEDADLIVHSFLFTTDAHSLARELGIPDVSVQIFPMFAPTREFPNVAMPNIPPGVLSYFSHWFSTQVFWHGGNSGYYRLRKTSPLDFPQKLYFPFRKGYTGTPLIFAYSPTVLPKPADWTAPNIHVTGYFFLGNEDFVASDELSRFLESGDPPVAISFGSMLNAGAERNHDAVVSALEKTGKRGIFLTGWGQKKPEFHNPNMLYLQEVPHEFLFPKCQAVIHHGGAGTTAAGLRAGIPNIVIPHAADQPFWAKRVAAIGCGPQPIPIKSVSGDYLAIALTTSQETAIRTHAQATGCKIQAENGVEAAIRVIESVL